MTNNEIMQRESNLVQKIQEKLPDFANACADDVEVVVLHQDAFAADYRDDEYLLLGMAKVCRALRQRGKRRRKQSSNGRGA